MREIVGAKINGSIITNNLPKIVEAAKAAEYDALVKQRDELLDLLSRYGVYAPSEVQDEINKALAAAPKEPTNEQP